MQDVDRQDNSIGGEETEMTTLDDRYQQSFRSGFRVGFGVGAAVAFALIAAAAMVVIAFAPIQ